MLKISSSNSKSIVMNPEILSTRKIYEQVPQRGVIEHTFDFDGKKVDAILIACTHDDHADAKFMVDTLNAQGKLNEKTIFIEQGSARVEDNMLGKIKQIAEQDSEIREEVARRQSVKWSTLSDEYENEPFSVVANFALEKGARVINADAHSNVSQEVIDFLIKEGIPEDCIIEIFYNGVTGTVSRKEIFEKILKQLLPFSKEMIQETNDRLYDYYVDEDGSPSLQGLQRMSATREYTNFIREKYMCEVLKKNLKTGDIVIAHPAHIANILKQQEQAIQRPSIPESIGR